MLGHVPTVEEQNRHYTRFYRRLLLDYRDFLAGRFVNDVAHAVEAVTSRDLFCPRPSAPLTRRPRFALEVVDERPSGSEEEQGGFTQAINALQESVKELAQRGKKGI